MFLRDLNTETVDLSGLLPVFSQFQLYLLFAAFPVFRSAGNKSDKQNYVTTPFINVNFLPNEC